MELPQVTLGELYSLLGERDVRIYQLERAIERFEAMMKPPPGVKPPQDVTPKKEDPFKKG
ncbi:MAG: hypothetical protein ACW99U_20510 [Candidatus Thorarchaeota archaeon]|jgi:hypothetical protein